MPTGFYAITILLCGVLTLKRTDAKNYNTTNIFKPPDQCDITEIQTSEVPWTKPDLVPTIIEFRKNILDGLKADPEVQKIWDSKPDSATIRKVYFELMNKVFSENSDPVPAALANIISKGASLFDKLDKETYFECDAVSIGQFLTSKGIAVNSTAAQGYVTAISKAIKVGDISNPEAEFQTLINGWEDFFKPYGFDVEDYQNDLILLFTSHLIVLFDKSK